MSQHIIVPPFSPHGKDLGYSYGKSRWKSSETRGRPRAQLIGAYMQSVTALSRFKGNHWNDQGRPGTHFTPLRYIHHHTEVIGRSLQHQSTQQ